MARTCRLDLLFCATLYIITTNRDKIAVKAKRARHVDKEKKELPNALESENGLLMWPRERENGTTK